MDKGEIRQIILDLTHERGPDKSICPSEAAKAINPDEKIWRFFLKTIRRTAIEMAQRLEQLGINCMWYEEPAPPETPDAIADIKSRTRLPIAVGERLHSRYMFRPILERQAADILMPDVTRCGGISELRKIATLAETYNVPIAPHNPNGPFSTIAAAHVVASIPNFFRLEFMLNDVPWRDTCLSQPLPIENGYFVIPDRPGLGFEVNEEVLLEHPGITEPKSGFYI